MAKMSKAAFYLYLFCTVLLLEEIDAMSLIFYSSTPPAVTEESDGTENPFSPDFTTRLDLVITETRSKTTTATSTTTLPSTILTETTSDTTATLPVPTTTPVVTTMTLPAAASILIETTSETTTTQSVSTSTPAATTTTLPVATSTPITNTMTPSVTDQDTTPGWTLPTTSSPCGAQGNCPHIVSRAEWGAKAPKSITAIRHPIPKVFIHHTAGESCTKEAECSRIVKGIQSDHRKKGSDIGYNFLVGEDGNAYEGRGWDVQGAHAKKWNPVSLGIAFIGKFIKRVPNAAALNTVQKLIACGVCKGKIAGNYTLHGHRDGCPTDCPGDALYNLIKTWPHYGGFLSKTC